MTYEQALDRDRGALQAALADEVAFRAFYDRAMPRVYGYLVSRSGGNRELAEELTQQTFIAAIDDRHRFDGRSDVVTWLCGIARHKLADHFRRRERDERRHLQLTVRWIAEAGDDVAWTSTDERAVIGAVLRRLPAAQRAALVFSDLDGLPVGDVARLLGRSVGATQSLITRGRESFRRVWREEVSDG